MVRGARGSIWMAPARARRQFATGIAKKDIRGAELANGAQMVPKWNQKVHHKVHNFGASWDTFRPQGEVLAPFGINVLPS